MSAVRIVLLLFLQVYLTNTLMDLTACSVSTSCLRLPQGCDSGTTCKSLATFVQGRPGYITMQLFAHSTFDYTSVCVSNDQSMGNDDCMDCINQSPITLMHSFNTGRSNTPTGLNVGLSLNSSDSGNGQFSCTFERIQVSSSNQDKMFDLSNNYYVMLAVGGVVGNGIKLKHSSTAITNNKVSLTQVASVLSIKPAPSKLIRAHGALMAAAWLLCATLGMFIARYLKAGWPGKKVSGLPMWFFLHRVLMMLAVLLSSIGFILVFVDVKGYSQLSSNFFESHPPIGIAVMALALLNPIMTIFRCEGGHNHRWLFNWAHYIVGNVALVLGFVNCYSGYDLIRDKEDGQNLVVAYGAFYVFMSIFMEIHVYCTRRAAKCEIDMSIEMDSSKQPEVKPKKKSHVRHIAFVIFALVTIAVYIGLLIFVLL